MVGFARIFIFKSQAPLVGGRLCGYAKVLIHCWFDEYPPAVFIWFLQHEIIKFTITRRVGIGFNRVALPDRPAVGMKVVFELRRIVYSVAVVVAFVERPG